VSGSTGTGARTAFLTGATSGIGRWSALGLAKAGYRVIAAGRDRQRGEELRAWVTSQAPTAQIEVVTADLSLMAEVRRLAGEVLERAPRLHVLVNNAGLARRSREVTAEGHELTLAVNHLAPFLLTRELLPTLMAAGRARIVNVGSVVSDRARIDLDDLENTRNWSTMRAYGRSKLALMVATFEWARRLDPDAVTANVVHPGGVATAIGEIGGVPGLAWRLIKPFLLSPEQGARTTLHVATSPAVAGVTGRYFKREASAEPNPLAKDTELAAQLWARTEAVVGEGRP
jgi:NAD(P)-dependent dehydrogenase (short-subunit alcohol dehydrogenase family)